MILFTDWHKSKINTMIQVYIHLLVIMTSVVLSSCYCPDELIHGTGPCSFRIHCTGDIRGVRLPIECTEATNFPVNVEVTITDAVDGFDENTDLEFLNTITSLKMTGQWQHAKLTILSYTPKLQNLVLVNNCIQNISGGPFYYLNSLITLNLSHNRLTDISELFQFENQPNKLRVLSLAYNAIEMLPGDAFGELSSLVELDLSFNAISDLTEEPFFNLTKLEKLRLNNNRIKDLNGAVNSLQNLKHLYLRGNSIQHINEESLMIIKHLETFDISWNQLEQIEPIMFSRHWNHFGNHSFCKIILTGNHITNLPNATSNEIFSRFARNLEKNMNINIVTELDLSSNVISNIEYNAFQSLMRLVTLDLSKNKLIDFRVDANDLADIKCLNLSGNYISHLYYESFVYMTNLQNLDLSHNNINYIPDMTFNNNYNLKYVNMTFNEIAKLDNIYIRMFHPEGGSLDLSNNGLFKLHIPHGEGIRLEKLILRSNIISDPTLVDLSHQTELKQLDMSVNQIEDLNSTSLLLPESTLMYLDLTCNKIQSIGPATFKRVPHLKTLRLGNNQLTKLEYGAFQGLTDLSNLDLSYNRITYLDSKYLLDLKYLHVLSLRSNDMIFLDMNSWYGHKVDLTLYVDNNNLTCEWLGRALKDYNNGYTRVRPTALVGGKGKNTLEGIPCIADESERLTGASQNVLADERLLVTSQKILEEVRQQNYYFRKFFQQQMEKSKI